MNALSGKSDLEKELDEGFNFWKKMDPTAPTSPAVVATKTTTTTATTTTTTTTTPLPSDVPTTKGQDENLPQQVPQIGASGVHVDDAAASTQVWILIMTTFVAVLFFHWWHRRTSLQQQQPQQQQQQRQGTNGSKTIINVEEERRLRRDRLAAAAAARSSHLSSTSSSFGGESLESAVEKQKVTTTTTTQPKATMMMTTTTTKPTKLTKPTTTAETASQAASPPVIVKKSSTDNAVTNKALLQKQPKNDKEASSALSKLSTDKQPDDDESCNQETNPPLSTTSLRHDNEDNHDNAVIVSKNVSTTISSSSSSTQLQTNLKDDPTLNDPLNIKHADSSGESLSNNHSPLHPTLELTSPILISSIAIKKVDEGEADDVAPAVKRLTSPALSSATSDINNINNEHQQSSATTMKDENEKTTVVLTRSSSQQLTPPPVQILCHALSWIMQQEVRVEPSREGETGAWAGVGWKSSLPPGYTTKSTTTTAATATKSNPIQLSFHRLYHLHHPEQEVPKDDNSKEENEWKAVLAAFSQILRDPELVVSSSSSSSSSWSDGWKLNNLRQVLQWYHQAELLLRNQGSPLIQWWTATTKTSSKNRKVTSASADSGKSSPWPYVSSGIQTFRRWLLEQVVVLWLGPPDELEIGHDDDDDVNEDDLFQNDYYDPLSTPWSSSPQSAAKGANASKTTPAGITGTTAPTNSRETITQLIALLENEDMDKVLVTHSFLDGLIQAYQGHYQDRLQQQKPEQQEGTGSATKTPSSSLFLAQALVRHCFMGLRALMVHQSTNGDDAHQSSSVLMMIRRRLAACTHLCTRSSHVTQALVHYLEKEEAAMRSSTNSKSGRDVERSLLIQPLCFLAAYTIPDVAVMMETGGMPDSSAATNTTTTTTTTLNLFHAQLQTLENFPMCVYSRNHHDGHAVHNLIEECRTNIRLVRQTATTVLSKALTKNKRQVLQWLAAIISSNEALTAMLSWELLDPDGVAALAATPAFLLGLASALVNFCSLSLLDRFEKQGIAAFDCMYLVKGHSELRFDDSSLVPSGTAQHENTPSATATTKPEPSIKFTGATEFFFVTSALLRVSLYPVLRVEEAFHQRHNKLLTMLYAPAPQLSQAAIQAAIPVTNALQGWSVFLNEPDFVAAITDFALLQLRWLASIARSNAAALATIPEWMCKEPAWWLAHVARHTSYNLKPHQANAAVDCATDLLEFGSNPVKGRAAFSPVVLTELIRIAAAFVHAGVSRAKRRQQMRKARHNDDDDDDDDPEFVEDEDAFGAYLSFDQSDLGVTVFTNRLVCTQLCPALLTAFSSLDIVEGLDVDKEHSFDKFSAKVEIGDLLLRLWSHPNGECRSSIIKLTGEHIAKFASSLAAALGFLLDDAIHRFADVCQNQKRKNPSFADQQFAERQASSAVSGCYGARRLALLMCYLSHDDKLATIMGSGDRKSDSSVCSDLANMIIHFVINLLTTLEGGTKPDLETMNSKETTQAMLLRSSDMSTTEKGSLVTEILKSRQFATREIGLDVASLCHMFLALAARWHRTSKGEDRISPILDALAANDDCDITQLRNVCNRMVKKPGLLAGTDVENASTIFEYDGYVDTTAWSEKYHVAPSSEIQKDRWRRARQCQVTPHEVEKLARERDIQDFLDDLDNIMRSKSEASASVAVNVEDTQSAILRANVTVAEEAYAEFLSEWVVSSDSFASPNDRSSYMHYYDKTARSRADTGSGKQLVKEARRCHKCLPTPHSNSASFVCFDDSRMDLCRAVVTGPCDTPYAHGVFVFDVFFPPTFPQIPPLVTFMTTGGGTTRFGPNLYQDGKVCLSLLGTFNALDESERWHPGVSSLAQILLSIQTQLLTAEPYFNEPGVEIMRGTPVGDDGSKRYNSGVRLATIRHAIISYLRAPPGGFEEVTLRHFSMCRKRIVVQALRWMIEAEGTPLYPKFQKAYAELLSLLSQEALQRYGTLPPLREDVQAVRKRDPTLLKDLLDDDEEDERKPKARPKRDSTTTTEQEREGNEAFNAEQANILASAIAMASYNPWASLPTATAAQASETHNKDDNSNNNDDDELYS